jgi:trk/ktr system potassium uptake protein
MSQKYKNIMVIGLGGMGYYLAKLLSHEGHALTVIEADPELVKRADGEIDARLIHGDAMSFRCWEAAGAKGIDYAIAVTDNDAVNIMSTLIADRYGVRRKIARVRSLELWDRKAILTADDLKIDLVIRPEETTALEIARLLKMRAGNVVIDVGGGQMQLLGTRIEAGSVLANTKLKEISGRHDDFYFRIVVIARGINTIIPGGDDELLPQDQVFVLVHNHDLDQLMALAGISKERRHRLMIVGGGDIGQRVAELLEGSFPVRLVEQQSRRAEELSYRLKRTEVLHGDGSDQGTLISAGLLEMDTIVVSTGDNETNIMTSVLAKHLIRNQPGERHGKEGKTITLVKREEYLVLASTMGSDIALNKKVLAANEVLKYIRRGQMLSVAHLHGSDADVVELVAEEGAPITRAPLFQVEGLRGKIIIGGVHHKGSWQIAVGPTQVQAGDRVIGICASRHLRNLQQLLLG